MSPEPRHAGDGKRHLSKWAIALIAVVTVMVVADGVYGGAVAYDSIYHLALRLHLTLPRLRPIGFEASLLTVVVADVVSTWLGHPAWILRMLSRFFIGASILANVVAGWPSVGGIVLSVPPPVIVAGIVESARYALMKNAREARGERGIPLARWLVSPLSTPPLQRRMVQWGQRDYEAAVTVEVSRRQAIMKLREFYGGGRRAWKKKAPDDLVWLLQTGNEITEACLRVEEIVAAGDGSGTSSRSPAGTGSRTSARTQTRTRSGPGSRTRTGPAGGTRKGTGSRTRAGTGTGTRPVDGAEPEAKARRIATEYYSANGRMMNLPEFGLALGRRKSDVSDLHKKIKVELTGEAVS